jgi:hypothetical protein
MLSAGCNETVVFRWKKNGANANLVKLFQFAGSSPNHALRDSQRCFARHASRQFAWAEWIIGEAYAFARIAILAELEAVTATRALSKN